MPAPSPLEALEAQMQELQKALVAADPVALEQHAHAVRNATTMLAQWLTSMPASALPPDAQPRARALATQLNATRDQLARVMALTSQQAASLLPPVDPVTYGPHGASKARIYRAPG